VGYRMAEVLYDFRSDTVTLPTEEMKRAMLVAPLGDDVFQDDPTVRKLEEKVAALCGKEDALFCASGTMTNQLGLRINLGPLQEVIGDAKSHVFVNENGGIHYHSQAAIRPIEHNGTYLTAELIEKHIRVDNHRCHNPTTRIISLENTLLGNIMPLEEVARIHQLAKKYNLIMHLDGARLWNATVATGHSLADYCQYFDTISLCLSKGLGAPVGSVLVASKREIAQAKHFRKLFGGGWRQAGILAAAGIYAIDHHWKRMSEDHANAKLLMAGLKKLGFLEKRPVETNLVWVDSSPLGIEFPHLGRYLAEHRILLDVSDEVPFVCRISIHIQTPTETCNKLLEAISKFIRIKQAKL